MSYSISVKKVNIDGKNLYSDTELVIKEHGITVIKEILTTVIGYGVLCIVASIPYVLKKKNYD